MELSPSKLFHGLQDPVKPRDVLVQITQSLFVGGLFRRGHREFLCQTRVAPNDSRQRLIADLGDVAMRHALLLTARLITDDDRGKSHDGKASQCVKRKSVRFVCSAHGG